MVNGYVITKWVALSLYIKYILLLVSHLKYYPILLTTLVVLNPLTSLSNYLITAQ